VSGAGYCFSLVNLTNSNDCMTASDASSQTNFGRTSTKSLNQAAEESGLLNCFKQNLHLYQLGKFQAVNSRKSFLMLSWVFNCRFQVWKYILNPGKRSKGAPKTLTQVKLHSKPKLHKKKGKKFKNFATVLEALVRKTTLPSTCVGCPNLAKLRSHVKNLRQFAPGGLLPYIS